MLTIRRKILLGCLALTAVTLLLGSFAQTAQRELGGIAVRLYDDAFLAMSYLRSAQNGLARAEAEYGRLSAEGSAAPDGAPHAVLGAALPDIVADLYVALERAMSPEGRTAAERLHARLAELRPAEADRDAALAALRAAQAAFDTAVEIYAADGYRHRRQAGDVVERAALRHRLAMGASVVAALAITALLSRSVVPALREAVRVAQAVAGGRLDNPIRVRGSGEAAQLLEALRVMQGSIAAALDRQVRLQQEASSTARRDALTGLPNRLLFHEHLQGALARARRGRHHRARQGEGLAVLCLDLDGFKAVNDTLGHPAGDALLRAVAERIRGCTRESDLVARLGGDEFAVIQEGGCQPTDAALLACRLVELLARPFEVEGHQVIVGTSIGVVLAGAGLDGADALLKCADLALYHAKAEGRGTWAFFEPEMDARVQARRLLETDLRGALAAGQLEVFYQPIIEADGGAVGGFEALLRWRHPQRGMVPPAEFIPLAEEIGLIGEIGAWVLRRACADAASWPGTPKVAVNLSPAQFRTRGLVAEAAQALAEAGLDPARLELEVTESLLLRDEARVLATLRGLRALGARIAMDDFGTGYSSLSYLRRFPFDKIKLDRSFVGGLDARDEHGADGTAIVRAVVGLGRSLGLVVCAEGVETAEQLAALRAEGCAEVQGYLFSKPRPPAEIPAVLKRCGDVWAEFDGADEIRCRGRDVELLTA